MNEGRISWKEEKSGKLNTALTYLVSDCPWRSLTWKFTSKYSDRRN
jgi:hypothetical protein